MKNQRNGGQPSGRRLGIMGYVIDCSNSLVEVRLMLYTFPHIVDNLRVIHNFYIINHSGVLA